MRFDEFIGTANPSASANLDLENSLNLIFEQAKPGSGKNQAYLRNRPGLSLFATMPTTPIRGLAAGEDRLFCAAGNHVYEVFTGGTYNDLGTIASLAWTSPAVTNGPVQMFLNGSQLYVVASGNAYVHDGSILSRPSDGSDYNGHVTTNGTLVSWVSGDAFDPVQMAVGKAIVINNALYTVSAYTDTHNILVTPGAGTQTNVPYVGAMTGAGTVNTSGTNVTLASGYGFDQYRCGTGEHIWINSVRYTIANYISATNVTLTTSAGTQTGVVYWNILPLAAITGGFVDGYFLAQQPSTRYDTGFLPYTPSYSGQVSKTVRISALNDGSSWDPLDYIVKEGGVDSIAGIHVDHRDVYLHGRKTIEVWRNEGDAFQILQRDPGGFAEIGTAGAWAITSLGGYTLFLSYASGNEGALIAYKMRGFQPERISTHAVEHAWRAFPSAVGDYQLQDTWGYGYVEDGHQFWVLSFPGPEQTWVYDLTTGLWSQWAYRDTLGTMYRHKGATHAYCWGKHFVGDSGNGRLYLSSFSYGSDNGDPVKYQRTAPHLSQEDTRITYDSFQLDMDTGAPASGTVSTGTFSVTWASGERFDPVLHAPGNTININGVNYTIGSYIDQYDLAVTTSAGSQINVPYFAQVALQLDWSGDDGGSWSGQKTASGGISGQFGKRVVWRRLGQSRDRVFRVTAISVSPQAWTNAYLKTRPGVS